MTETAKAFTDADRVRFQSLLRMAAESPFPGERANALAAATRLAGRAGMSLQEAATADAGHRQAPPRREEPMQQPPSHLREELARQSFMLDQQIIADKARRAAAVREAIRRGLDWDTQPRPAPRTETRRTVNSSRMDSHRHAGVLLRETSLPLQEICTITGLDIYEVVGMKLKARVN